MKKFICLFVSVLSLSCMHEGICSEKGADLNNYSNDISNQEVAHCGGGGCGHHRGYGSCYYDNDYHHHCRGCGRNFNSNDRYGDYCEDCCPRHGQHRGECQNPDKGPGYGRGEGRGYGQYREDNKK